MLSSQHVHMKNIWQNVIYFTITWPFVYMSGKCKINTDVGINKNKNMYFRNSIGT